jgi:hypothetical protein
MQMAEALPEEVSSKNFSLVYLRFAGWSCHANAKRKTRPTVKMRIPGIVLPLL